MEEDPKRIESRDHFVNLWRRVSGLSLLQRAVAIGIVITLIAVFPMVVGGYMISIGFSIFLFITLALGWNFLSGFTGYVDFGYSTFVGLGAYFTILQIVDGGIHWSTALVISTVATAMIGVLLGVPLLRLRGVYFAIAMLSASIAVRVVVATSLLEPVTRGGSGISFLVELRFTGQYYLAAAVALSTSYLTYRIATSPFGLRLLAIREDELLASALGVKTTREKLIAMALHAGIAGLAGGMLAFNLSYIDPSTVFDIRYTEYPVIMVLFGSLGTVVGPIIGAVVVMLLEEALWTEFPSLHQGLLGVAIVFLVLFLPEGVIEWLKENEYVPRERSI